MEHLRCVVERITYQNTENGYSVIKCRAKGFADLVTVVGSMPDVHVGSVLYLGGQWRVDARYGRQFSMETFEETLPATVFGIEKYLGSGLIKGIGPKFARKIVQEFGKDTLDVIEEDPDSLIRVPGIGKTRVERIKQSWQEQKEIKNIMLFLQSHDVSTSHATKIYKTYGNESIRIVQENPYRLADDIWGIGFKTADTIAGKMGFDHEKYVRLRSGLLYTLNRLSDEGHCYATRDQLLQEALNPEGPGLRRGGYIFRVRDKVMQIRNNYDKEVFNGDIGVVAYVDTEERNLIYTGITRAKKILVLIGTKKALAYAVKHVTVTERNTMLKERLQKALPVIEPKVTPAAFSPSAEYPQTAAKGLKAAEGEVPYHADCESRRQVP